MVSTGKINKLIDVRCWERHLKAASLQPNKVSQTNTQPHFPAAFLTSVIFEFSRKGCLLCLTLKLEILGKIRGCAGLSERPFLPLSHSC